MENMDIESAVSEDSFWDDGEVKRENPFLRFLKAVGRGIKGAAKRIGRFAKKHKILTVLIVLILIAAIVALAVWQSRSRRPQMQQTMTVETATVERMDLTNSIGVTGTLATAEGKSGTTTLENIEVTAVYVEVGDEELEGEVTYVSPVGTSGQTMGSASGTASYEIQITINEPQDKLRSGMTASVSIALEKSKDTLAVPYDCVQTNEAGESVIYVDDNGERKEVAVETGIETDYYIEVSSDEISEGMTVYLSTPLVQSGAGAGTEGGTEEEGTGLFETGGDMGGGMPSRGGGGMGGAPSGGGGMGGF